MQRGVLGVASKCHMLCRRWYLLSCRLIFHVLGLHAAPHAVQHGAGRTGSRVGAIYLCSWLVGAARGVNVRQHRLNADVVAAAGGERVHTVCAAGRL